MSDVVLSARGLSKFYGPVTACEDVDIDIPSGQVTAIDGDNGAGKSTVMKILAGALKPDAGTIFRNGQAVSFSSTHEAQQHGVEVVFQDLALCPNLDVAANIFLGRELSRRSRLFPWVRIAKKAAMAEQATEEIERLKVRIPRVTGAKVGSMSGGQRQSVAVARAIFWAKDVLLMDEPTAALGVKESGAVLNLVHEAKNRGIAVVIVSHAMPHVVDLADRVVVMRHGHKVAELGSGDLSVDRLVREIVGA